MAHDHAHAARDADRHSLKVALGLILAFMAVEVIVGVLARSLALLSDAGHMLTDALALALSLLAARLAARPARGAMTYGLGRVEILSAQMNGLTLVLLAAFIVYGAVRRLVSPAHVTGGAVLGVALAGVAVNLLVAWVLSVDRSHPRSLNLEGSYRHVLTDLYGFALTALAAVVILVSGWERADAVASLAIAAIMLAGGAGLLRASIRVFLEAAPAGLDPQAIGRSLAAEPGVVQVHDLHVWEVTSGFPALSAHVVVRAGEDCHEVRRALQRLLEDGYHLHHTTLQVDHEAAHQRPLQIEVSQRTRADRLAP
jgi:cobalt-zinc-cadmium efflux system protein